MVNPHSLRYRRRHFGGCSQFYHLIAADVGFIGMILFKVLPVVDILVGIMCIGIIYPCIIHE